MESDEHSEDIFWKFVSTMDISNRPEYLLITGGEPMLRPRLVKRVADHAHSIGTHVVLGSGMFFATARRTSDEIWAALVAVDHITMSIDAFHEKEVPREAVFRTAKELLDRGKSVSFQVVGFDEFDPYLKDITSAIERTFGRDVPAFIGRIGPKGRAKDLLNQIDDLREGQGGCLGSSWPVVAYDGTVVTCCNQDVVNGPRAPHLALGHASTNSWRVIRERVLTSDALRAIRAYGPIEIATQQDTQPCDGYCLTCSKLPENPKFKATVAKMASGAGLLLMEHTAEKLGLNLSDLNLPGYEDWSGRGFIADTTL